MGHARALLGLPDRAEQLRLAARIQREDLSVRQTEQVVNDRLRRRAPQPAEAGPKPPHLADLEAKLREALATRVTILQHRHDAGGRILIDFFTADDFQRLLERFLSARPEPATAPTPTPPSPPNGPVGSC
jgi:ParB family chromosome partitioning protein